jgi:hypothetical protein
MDSFRRTLIYEDGSRLLLVRSRTMENPGDSERKIFEN